MSGSLVINVLVVAGFVAFVIYEIRHRRKRKDIFAACAARLGMTDVTTADEALAGKARGLPLDVRFVSATKTRPAHTKIQVGCEPCRVLLHLRRQTVDEIDAVRRGEARDLILGDRALDDAWIIEGAPTERVARVLSGAELRARLAAFAQVEGARVVIEDGKLTLEKHGTEVGEHEIATERIELALALAEAVIADARAPLAGGEIDAERATYRTAPLASTEAEDRRKIEELQALQATRAMDQIRIGAIASHLFLVVMILGFHLVEMPGPGMLPLLLFPAFLTTAVLSAYRSHKRKVPSLSFDRGAAWVMIATWALYLALTARALLAG